MDLIAVKKKGEGHGLGSRRALCGTTLIEILVVIVVLLVGILAIAQIFPGGLKILQLTRNRSVATALARSEVARLQARADQLPEEIVPVMYTMNGGNVVVSDDATRNPANYGLTQSAVSIDGTGNALDAANNVLGNWKQLSGPNAYRRVIGESSVIPSPQTIGSYFGSLMVLQFAPILMRAPYTSGVTVYGNDMAGTDGVPTLPLRPYEYYLNSDDTTQPMLYLPADGGVYRLEATYYANTTSGIQKRDLVDQTIISQVGGGFYTLNLATGDVTNPNPLALQVGDTVAGIDFGTVRIARQFQMIPNVQAFSNTTPYEFKILDPNLGLILFNPMGYNYKVLTNSGDRVPLRGRVNYDVLDWRNLHDDFRLASVNDADHKLPAGPIKALTGTGADSLAETGLDIPLPDGNGNTVSKNLVVMDLQTGGVLLDVSTVNAGKPLITQDSTNAVLHFSDDDSNPANGLTGEIVLPGQTSAVQVDLVGRPLRAIYQAQGEWSVQVLKAAALYSESYSAPGIGQYYVGGTNPGLGGLPTRIYFPICDIGQKVSFGQIWYDNGGATPLVAQDATLQISTSISDPLAPLPSIDIRDLDPSATGIDLSKGYAARDVTGASVFVRVSFNPDIWHVVPTDPATTMQNFNTWLQSWRSETTESYVNGGQL